MLLLWASGYRTEVILVVHSSVVHNNIHSVGFPVGRAIETVNHKSCNFDSHWQQSTIGLCPQNLYLLFSSMAICHHALKATASLTVGTGDFWPDTPPSSLLCTCVGGPYESNQGDDLRVMGWAATLPVRRQYVPFLAKTPSLKSGFCLVS